MKQLPHFLRWWIGLVMVPLWLAGCSGPREGEGAPNRRARAQQEAPQPADLRLSVPLDQVQTIQLYAGKEDRLPILPLRSGQKLTLEFDLMEPSGRPLSVYFYHANQRWQRDLMASEYLTSFDRDDLFDYAPSRNTQVAYTHYTYTFPNQSINFRISGNFILRVTEQGREDEALFERAFFVTEQAAALQFNIDQVMTGGSGYPSSQPIVSFTPPPALSGNVFDYHVCFVRNGQLEGARCSERPSLTQQPDLLFYLQPEGSFEPQGADYFLNLSRVRVGGKVEQADRSVSPFVVVLEPDYARFPASGLDPLLDGQAVVSGAVRDVGNPDIEGEYVEVQFAYVPPEEQRLSGGLYLAGSFNGWRIDLGKELRWVAERGRYEGRQLIKQGHYEYRYTSPNRQVVRELRNALPRPENTYAAFVYFSDTSLQTDRLLATQTVRAQ